MDDNAFIAKAKRLLDWNREKLTASSDLSLEDIGELFAPEFVIRANERTYAANNQNYFEFLEGFRSDIGSIEYEVEEYICDGATVVLPLVATINRLNGDRELIDAIMIIKFNDLGKIVHWQEVYSMRGGTDGLD